VWPRGDGRSSGLYGVSIIESFGDIRTAALLKGWAVNGMPHALQRPAMIRLPCMVVHREAGVSR